MNNVRNSEQLARGWLKVQKVREEKDKVVVRSNLFDGTFFEFTIASHQYEAQSDESPGLVCVNIIGSVGQNYTEVLLPAPALNFGHNVRVSPDAVVDWQLYNLRKGAK
jgi:hypothetical protein